MKTSQQGLDFIAANEGVRLYIYKDSTGKNTVGVGHLITGNENPPIINPITNDWAMRLLANDVKVAEGAVDSYVSVRLNQQQFDALVDFVFNVGIGHFTSSTLLDVLNTGDYSGAADQLLKWDIAGGKVVRGLENRRNRERELFLNGDYSNV